MPSENRNRQDHYPNGKLRAFYQIFCSLESPYANALAFPGAGGPPGGPKKRLNKAEPYYTF
jgi:hypothetical protein